MKDLLNMLALLKVLGDNDINDKEDSVTDWDWVFQDEKKKNTDFKIIRNIPIYKIYNKTYHC